MDIAELVDKGFSHLELVQDLDANIAVADLEDAGVSAADITVLRSRLADLEKGSNLGIIIGVVVAAAVIVGIVLFYRSKSTIDRDVTFVNDVKVKQRPKKAGSRPRSRPSSSWMHDASRTDAETLLKGCRSGTFLVRSCNDTSYAFSVIIRNRVVHKLIKEATPGEFTVDGKGGEWGSSLESVVAVVSLQMGTEYECAMYPLSAAAKQPETPARRPIRGMANAQPRTPARNDAGTRANATTGEQTYEEIDDVVVSAPPQSLSEEVDDNHAGAGGTASGIVYATYASTDVRALGGQPTAYSGGLPALDVPGPYSAADPRTEPVAYSDGLPALNTAEPYSLPDPLDGSVPRQTSDV